MYLEEVGKDFNVFFVKFIMFVELIIEFFCDLDDFIYRVIDVFFRVMLIIYYLLFLKFSMINERLREYK